MALVLTTVGGHDEEERVVRFKQFRSAGGESVEGAINRWLDEAKPDVQFMAQSAGVGGETTVSFLYEEGFHATEQRLTEEASAIVVQAQKERAGAPLLDPVVVDENLP